MKQSTYNIIVKCIQHGAPALTEDLMQEFNQTVTNDNILVQQQIAEEQAIYSVLHMGRGIFGIDFGSASFVVRNSRLSNYIQGHNCRNLCPKFWRTNF